MITPHIDAVATALHQYYSLNDALHNQIGLCPTRHEVAAARVKAQKMFAQIDWVEPEVDPSTLEGHYLEMLYQAGRRCGMLCADEMTEEELELYGVFNDLS